MSDTETLLTLGNVAEKGSDSDLTVSASNQQSYEINVRFKVADIHKTMSKIKGVVERKATIPVLKNVLIRITNFSQAELIVSDMDLMASVVVNAESDAKVGNTKATVNDLKEIGVITVPALTFYEILSALNKDSDVVITKKCANENGQSKITYDITSDSYSINIPYVDVDNFPFVNLDEYDAEFEINASLLENVLNKTSFAISNDETKFFLNGIYLHQKSEAESNVLCFVSTDLHRLAKSEVILADKLSPFKGIIIPRKAISELTGLLEKSIGMVNVKISKTKVSFKFDTSILVTKLIDGEFPEYQNAIPSIESSEVKVNINKAKLVNAVNLISIVAPEKTQSIKFSLVANDQISLVDLNGEEEGEKKGKKKAKSEDEATRDTSDSENGTFLVSTSSENSAKAEQAIAMNFEPQDKNLEINFNAKYVLEVLKVVESDKVDLYFKDSFSAVLVKDQKDSDSLYIIMPTRG
ncbi:MAG: DNA polymerase III subunit beta [Sphingobacteriia bacterium]|nr:DNA polymerase III subunit beta [Sphingobacteriia bacterium]